MHAKKTIPDQFEDELVLALAKVCDKAHGKNWCLSTWTKEVKDSVALVCTVWGYEVWASGIEAKDKMHKGEWVFDLIAMEYDAGALHDILLVMESEWSSDIDSVDDDFEKLILARAKHRLIVMNLDNENISQLLKHAETFMHSLLGDRYLLANWNGQNDCFDFFAYELMK